METYSHDRPPAARHARPWDGGVMSDLLRDLARAKAVFQLRAIQAVIGDHPSTPAGSGGSTSNADPDATIQALPSGDTKSTEKPPS